MPINMVQGQSVILEKEDYDFTKVTIGLGWDIRELPKKMIPSFLSKKKTFQYDLDTFAFLLNENGKIPELPDDVIYYNNLKSKDGSIEHGGDNLTGKGDGDDEQIYIRLSSLSHQYHQIIVGVNIHQGEERKQDFVGIKNAYVRACDTNGKEVCRFDLSKNIYHGHTTMLLGNLFKRNGHWKFLALGEPKLGNLQDLVGGFISKDDLTKVPSTIKLSLHK
jgi:tellurium resistance protein TerD